MAKLRDNDVRIDNVRLSFPVLVEPKPVMQGKATDQTPYYQATFLLPPTFDRRPLIAALKVAMVLKWGKEVPISRDKNPIKSCEGMTYAGYAPGWWFVRTKTKRKPGLVDVNGAPLSPEDYEKLYPGRYVNALVSAFGWEFSGIKGVSFSLSGIQCARDAERLDAQHNVLDVFGALSDDELGEQATADVGGSDLDFLDG